MNKPRVFLLLPCFVPNDAVGNDVLGMYEWLRASGYEARIFAGEFADAYREIAGPLELEADQYWNSPEDILIYHHAIGWPLGEAVLARTRNKVVIKYHNITPPHFFENRAPHYHAACVEGLKATRRLALLPAAAFWGDSWFNAEELVSLGAPRERCRALAPFHHTERLNGEPMDDHILGHYRDGVLNLLFVGGLKPNKGHAHAIRAFAAYRQIYDSRARLILVGNFDAALNEYFNELKALAERLGVERNVSFAHSVSARQLKTFYYVADLFLCVSEHEGFCVPLVEAMAARLPILAWGTTAVPETAGDAGIVMKEFDPVEFAEAIDRSRHDLVMRQELAARGRRRYEQRFHPDAIRREIGGLLREVEEQEVEEMAHE